MPHNNSSRAIATIDLNAIAANYRHLQTLCGKAHVAATIKANGYGLGASEIAKTVYQQGCRTFYVAHYEEALPLRAQFQDLEILVLHGIPHDAQREATEKNITGIITGPDALERARLEAKRSYKKINASLHLDTGMNRIGFSLKEWRALMDAPELLEGMNVMRLMSHFACSDEPENPMNVTQRDIFILETEHFIRIRKSPTIKSHIIKSLCNSHGIYLGQDMHFDEVRPGRALSGIAIPGMAGTGLRTALSLHAPIIHLRLIDSDGTVGYGATQRVFKGMRLAALAIGYADGLRRSFGNTDKAQSHHFYFKGMKVPVLGRISMDLTMVDVTGIPEQSIHVGDMVEIAGTQQSIDDVAAQIGSIGYELMTQLGHRIERRYIPLA